MNKRRLLAFALASMVAAGAQAQTFPDKPVKVILPFPTGTGPDTVMRLVGERLAKIWGQQVVIENRAGANGWLAMGAAKAAAADGYTLLQTDAPPIAVAPYLWKKLPYDPNKDFEPIAGLYRTYYFVTVAADSKWNSVADLIAAAKVEPGKLTFGSSGNGGNLHLGRRDDGAGRRRQDDAHSVQGKRRRSTCRSTPATSAGPWAPHRPRCRCSRPTG